MGYQIYKNGIVMFLKCSSVWLKRYIAIFFLSYDPNAFFAYQNKI